MPPGVDALKHIVVLMMENRSFDHMLGGLHEVDSRIDGLTGAEANPDTKGQSVKVQPLAKYQSQLEPDPGHHFEDVRTQLFWTPNGSTEPVASMQGFVKSYFDVKKDVKHSHNIMNYFPANKVPVLATLAQKYAVCNRWFSSLPGPTIPNRAFAHFGTSFGKVDMSINYLGKPIKTIYERMIAAGRSAKIYYYDDPSGTIGMAFLLKDQPKLFGTFNQFKEDCASGELPDYSFIEPNYTDHSGDDGEIVASDQHPDHTVLAGEKFIAAVYQNIRSNPELWKSTLLLIVYDEHGGIYDHVVPPPVVADDFQDQQTGFKFDRLGVRVPAVLVSPWIPAGTVIGPNGTVAASKMFEHASIPATVTQQFIGDPATHSPGTREKKAPTFLDALTLQQPREELIFFRAKGGIFGRQAAPSATPALTIEDVPESAYQPKRKVSGLLLEHIEHLRKTELTLPPEQQTHIDVARIKTEEDAANYIRKAMEKIKTAAKAAGASQ